MDKQDKKHYGSGHTVLVEGVVLQPTYSYHLPLDKTPQYGRHFISHRISKVLLVQFSF